LARVRDVAGIVVVSRNFMPGDNRSWLQSLKLVERGNPFKPALRVCLDKIRVDSIVDDISGNNQADRRDVQAR
jgi:hypothetical protein